MKDTPNEAQPQGMTPVPTIPDPPPESAPHAVWDRWLEQAMAAAECPRFMHATVAGQVVQHERRQAIFTEQRRRNWPQVRVMVPAYAAWYAEERARSEAEWQRRREAASQSDSDPDIQPGRVFNPEGGVASGDWLSGKVFDVERKP